MATVDPQMAMAGSSGITITMIVFSAIGLVVWAISIGRQSVRLGLYLLPACMPWTTAAVWVWVGACVSIADNAGMIYVACRLIFLVRVRARTATTTGPVHAASPIVLQPPQTQYNQPLEEQRL